MTTNNHPANGPVSLDRLHQIRETLSKASAQSDGGNLCYAMADAVKVIDGVLTGYGKDPRSNPVLAYADSYRDMAKRGVESIQIWNVITDLERNIAPLFTRTYPSVPAVLDEKRDDDGSVTSDFDQGWNAYRADMLQAGNSPATPDDLEDTKRLDWLDAQNKRLNEYYGTAYGWKFDANFQRNAMMLNDSNYPVMTVRQAIDEAIAEAPKQENI